MELLDKGKHCEEEFCHQLDLLPMQCKACKKYFCSTHFKYDSHNCQQSNGLNYKIPICELCNKTIEFKRGKDLDLCLAEHLQNCQFNESKSSINKQMTNQKSKCQYENCKSSDVFRFECECCLQTFCNKHRIPEVHRCNRFQTGQSCSKQFNSKEKRKEQQMFSFTYF
jgi:hypothetical protein